MDWWACGCASCLVLSGRQDHDKISQDHGRAIGPLFMDRQGESASVGRRPCNVCLATFIHRRPSFPTAVRSPTGQAGWLHVAYGPPRPPPGAAALRRPGVGGDVHGDEQSQLIRRRALWATRGADCKRVTVWGRDHAAGRMRRSDQALCCK